MTYTLTLCIGMFLSLCGQVRTFDYPNQADCERARISFPEKKLGDGYAVCAPKQERQRTEK